VASGVMGVIGLLGAGVLWRYIPRYAPRHPRSIPTDPISRKDR
jgi:hypothetical protein